MQRLKFLSLCGIGLVSVFLLFKALFSDSLFAGKTVPSDADAVLPSSASSSSSPPFIVRVSPLLRKEKPSASAPATISSFIPSKILYNPYTSDASLDGASVLLFFAQSSDPFSMDHDAVLTSLSQNNQLRIPTFRVDFSSMSMRLRYGVIVPDTFVLLDATGQRIQSIIHPSPAELHVLLTSPLP